jgi:protein disulfide-isomerase A6
LLWWNSLLPGNIWLIERCGHCKALEPEYAAAARKLKGLVKLVAVDCDDKSNSQLCGKYGVQGFPTVKIFGAGVKGMPQGKRASKIRL